MSTSAAISTPPAPAGQAPSPSPSRPGYDEDEDWSLFYPCSDGKPMADNTEQLDWIITILENLLVLLADREAFAAGNLMWYPIKNNAQFFLVPDVMVALSRPQRHRLSYIQSREKGVAPQIAFEIISPKNTKAEMDEKLRLYELHGVQEYYVYDPDTPRNLKEMERDERGKRKVRMRLQGYQRQADRLVEIPTMNGWVSPLLGSRFQFHSKTGLEIRHPNGEPFEKFTNLNRRLRDVIGERDHLVKERDEFNKRLVKEQNEANQAKAKLVKERDEALAQILALQKQLAALGIPPSQDDSSSSGQSAT